MNLTIAKRKSDENEILEVRSLTTADLGLLRQPTCGISPIKTIRERHHHIAWLMALGRSNADIAAELHIDQGRLSQYRSDPAMKELIAKKFAEIEAARLEAATDFATTTVRGMALAEKELINRLESAPDEVSFTALNRYTVDRMDRFGYPKHTTSDNRNVNVNFATKLESAISRSRKAG